VPFRYLIADDSGADDHVPRRRLTDRQTADVPEEMFGP
jgi:hypothetical protein